MLALLRADPEGEVRDESALIVEEVLAQLQAVKPETESERLYVQRSSEVVRQALAHDPVTARKLAEMMGLMDLVREVEG
jgi:hypothetical protein